MRLDLLLDATEVLASEADPALEVAAVAYDSRAVAPGDLFVAVPGLKADGHDFVGNAAARGAVAAVVERDVPGPPLPLVRVSSARKALGDLACRRYDEPTRVLTLVGVTGTNGKTTTCYLLESILTAAGHVAGLVGTVEPRLRGQRMEAPEAVAARTTPEAPDLQALFARMVRDGATAAAMEVSSHALALERVRGCAFDAAVFTNLTPDHLDFHATMERYFAAKRRLFTEYAPGAAAINVDDPWGRRLAADVPGAVTFGVEGQPEGPPPKVRPTDLAVDADGIRFVVLHEHGEVAVVSSLVGTHNVYNLLGAVAAGLALGLKSDAIGRGLAAASPVPGRLERVEAGQDFTVLVDYAHTPDALERVLAAVRPLVRAGAPPAPPLTGPHGAAAPQPARAGALPGRLITVIGCGGDRDRTKRAPMGAAAVKGSDRVFFTADNPRSESPEAICAAMAQGARGAASRFTVVVDREAAIRAALSEARAGDVVLLAGKGHEKVQILADRAIPFDDREVARRLLGAGGS
jgi:UDP-N-acetylmuramoyl-L-alanyl-D-glutamate--2,6-diaminopimelate ligase